MLCMCAFVSRSCFRAPSLGTNVDVMGSACCPTCTSNSQLELRDHGLLQGVGDGHLDDDKQQRHRAEGVRQSFLHCCTRLGACPRCVPEAFQDEKQGRVGCGYVVECDPFPGIGAQLSRSPTGGWLVVAPPRVPCETRHLAELEL